MGGDEDAPLDRREPGKMGLERGEMDVEENRGIGSDGNEALQDEEEEDEGAALAIEHLQRVHEENDGEGHGAENVGGIQENAEEEEENHEREVDLDGIRSNAMRTMSWPFDERGRTA